MRTAFVLIALTTGCSIDFDRYHSASALLTDAGATDHAQAPIDTPSSHNDTPTPPEDVPVLTNDIPDHRVDVPVPTDHGVVAVDTPQPVLCPMPFIAVTVEALPPNTHGKLLRFQLDRSYTQCNEISLPVAQPMALAYVPTRGLVVAARDAVVTIEPASGALTDMIPYDGPSYPLEVVPIFTDTDWGYLVGWANPGSSDEEIQSVFRFGPTGRVSPDWSSAQIGQFTRTMSRHPFSASHYVVLRNGAPTQDVSPSPIAPHPRTNLTSDIRNTLGRIHTVFSRSGTASMTWTAGYGVYVNSNASAPAPVSYGNLVISRCSDVACLSNYIRAAAHPTNNGEAFALCDGPGDFTHRQIHLVGGDSSTPCRVFDAAPLGTGWRVSNLTVVTGM